MRIGIDARMYGAEKTTGIGSYIRYLTDNLFLIDTSTSLSTGKENEYILFLLEPEYSKFICPNQRVKKIKVSCPWYSWSEQLKYWRILEKQKTDLIHFPHFNVPIFFTHKFVVTIHDITPYFFPGPKVVKSKFRKLAYETVFRSTLKRAEKIITASNSTKNDLVKLFNISLKKIEVIYEGVGHQFKIIGDIQKIEELKKKYRIEKPFIFYVGVWRDHKNLPGLIKAFKILKDKYKLNYQLVLGGKEDTRYPEIRETWQNSGLKVGKDIILPGFIIEDELPLFYNAAESFVLPSFCEGFGLVALEAMACGTPVVGSKTTSLPEILGQASLYFDPSDYQQMAKTIWKVLSDKKLSQELINRGLEKVKDYSWQECAKKTLLVYQRVLS